MCQSDERLVDALLLDDGFLKERHQSVQRKDIVVHVVLRITIAMHTQVGKQI